jgi:hypothetical protein
VKPLVMSVIFRAAAFGASEPAHEPNEEMVV